MEGWGFPGPPSFNPKDEHSVVVTALCLGKLAEEAPAGTLLRCDEFERKAGAGDAVAAGHEHQLARNLAHVHYRSEKVAKHLAVPLMDR